MDATRQRIPRDPEDDYTREAAESAAGVRRGATGAELEHVSSYSFDPAILPGNVENFIGVAQVPIGLAGPLLVDGEHAQGEFYVPLATAEGTLVASYNRGMRLLHEAGGVTTTVLDDAMQRAPAFVFADAREARELRRLARRELRRDQATRPRPPRARASCATSSSTRPAASSSRRFNYTTATRPART